MHFLLKWGLGAWVGATPWLDPILTQREWSQHFLVPTTTRCRGVGMAQMVFLGPKCPLDGPAAAGPGAMRRRASPVPFSSGTTHLCIRRSQKSKLEPSNR